VIDPEHVYRTPDAGGTWTDVTGDLLPERARALRQLAYVPGIPNNFLVAATEAGVFVSSTTALGAWQSLGSGLPNVPVWDLDYDPTDDVLVACTLGRGAWKLSDVRRDLGSVTTTTMASVTTTTMASVTTSTTLPDSMTITVPGPTTTTLPCSSARCTL